MIRAGTKAALATGIAVALVGCSGGLEQALRSTGPQKPSYANVLTNATMVRLADMPGVPERVKSDLRRQLDKAVWPRGIGLVVDDSNDATLVLSGGLVAQNASAQTVVSYRWSILDQDGQEVGNVVGEEVIPASAAVGAQQLARPQTVSVESGDTLSELARDHGVTVKDLRAANGLKSSTIRVGQKLKLRAAVAPAPPSDPWSSVTADVMGRVADAIATELSRLVPQRVSNNAN